MNQYKTNNFNVSGYKRLINKPSFIFRHSFIFSFVSVEYVSPEYNLFVYSKFHRVISSPFSELLVAYVSRRACQFALFCANNSIDQLVTNVSVAFHRVSVFSLVHFIRKIKFSGKVYIFLDSLLYKFMPIFRYYPTVL